MPHAYLRFPYPILSSSMCLYAAYTAIALHCASRPVPSAYIRRPATLHLAARPFTPIDMRGLRQALQSRNPYNSIHS
jgi:hypothetical protein